MSRRVGLIVELKRRLLLKNAWVVMKRCFVNNVRLQTSESCKVVWNSKFVTEYLRMPRQKRKCDPKACEEKERRIKAAVAAVSAGKFGVAYSTLQEL